MTIDKKSYVDLPVTGGYVTKVDPETAEKLKGKRIFISRGHNLYPCIWQNGKNIRVHRIVLNAEKMQICDHINGDTFDNRRCNLRICDTSINRINSHTSVKSATGFRGVRFYENKNKFRVCIQFRNKRYRHIFNNKYIAAIFRDRKVLELTKLKVSQNFENKICENDLYDFLESTNGKIFKMCFVKRSDGSFREMICRTGVKKHLNGKGMAYDSKFHNLFVVFDMHNKSYKCIPAENIICMTFEKNNYLVKRNRLVA